MKFLKFAISYITPNCREIKIWQEVQIEFQNYCHSKGLDLSGLRPLLFWQSTLEV